MNWPRLDASASLKAALSIALLILLLQRVDFRAIIATLCRLSLGAWLLNLLLFLTSNFMAAAKWKLLLTEQRFTTLLKLGFVGQYYSMLLPGQVAGEAVKAYRLGKGKGDAERIAASVIIDRITGILGLLGVAICGVALTPTPVRHHILIALLLATLALLALLFSFRLTWTKILLGAIENYGPRAARVSGHLRRLLAAWEAYVKVPPLMLTSVLLGASIQLVAVWINYRIGRELGLQIQVLDWCWVFGVVSVVTALPLTIGGLGLREGSFVGSLGLLGTVPEKSMAVSFAVFSLLLTGAAIGGVLDWTRSKSAYVHSQNC